MDMVIKHNSSKFKNINSNSDKSGMILDIRTLDILVKYVLSTSSYLRMNHLSNLKRLMSYQNLDNYSNDIDKTHKIIFINKALEARIVYNLKDINMILTHINSEINFDINFIDIDNIALDANEVLWCHNMVSSSLQYYFVYDAADSLIDICTDIKTTDYSHRGDVIKRLESTVDDLKNKFRQSKSADNLTDITFSLKDGVFEDAVKETYNEVTSPSRKLRSGMQGLNEMVGGGLS